MLGGRARGGSEATVALAEQFARVPTSYVERCRTSALGHPRPTLRRHTEFYRAGRPGAEGVWWSGSTDLRVSNDGRDHGTVTNDIWDE